MKVSRHLIPTLAGLLACGTVFGQVHGESFEPWRGHDEMQTTQPLTLTRDFDSTGLPGLRPRLTMSLPLGPGSEPAFGGETSRSTFSWSLEAWQLNTASLAHIQCNHHSLTIDSFLAEDCRFVDQPVPEDSVNLVQVRGEWMAAPGLSLGLSAFRSQPDNSGHSGRYLNPRPINHFEQASPDFYGSSTSQPMDGLDVNVSFGISTERVGDFLLGLQLARYRQRMSLVELGLFGDQSMAASGELNHYSNSAQIALGWRLGSFSGDILGHHRDSPLWLYGGSNASPFQSFDLEFSWRPRNASLSIGISNVLDASPRGEDSDAAADDPLDHVFGRIPYVRYKHDL
jgi:hypothetical protein